MDKKTKLLFISFFFVAFVFTFFSYKKYFLDKDYLITAEVPCNPEQEVCFVGYCDSEVEECEEDVFYYKKIEGEANSLPGCDPNYDDCPLRWCGEDSNNSCRPIPCVEGCSSPDDFLPETEGMIENVETSSEKQENPKTQ